MPSILVPPQSQPIASTATRRRCRSRLKRGTTPPAGCGTPLENPISQDPRRVQTSPLPHHESNGFPDKFCHTMIEHPRLDPSPQRSGPRKFADSVNSATRQTSVNVSIGYRCNIRSASPIMSAEVHTLKRSRSPTMAPPGVSTTGPHIREFDSEREIQAKAKRLARFSAELNQPVSDLLDQNRNIFSEAKPNSTVDKNCAIGYSGKEFAVLQGTTHDQEEHGPSAPIVGFCLDMCPELERDERERKGDLDQYERLDGNRNQTHVSLAIKKYNRTAKREAALIRPVPVLRKTMDYLLHLLDQPYDDKFLGLYNFLWDRMRAVRMDLRTQHIFNQDAIIMLEQMIRLHIVAMHELCEYQKGEGFSEGFDAHLNIEQMNKAYVELFQMYDDHRKKGLVVMTESEFRGYYALLKVDRHPGFKVEPAELSLDLAKMPPSLRRSEEISFSRDVARACRTGNFIAFFRLARKATYLQACLMHAHFSKVRTNALASLHSGLQNNQGIPISQVVQWLGMEGEDIGSLLEYHGFVIKSFEEAYMIKEGPFSNRDTYYTTKCSKLVHCNKSRKIIDDVSSNRTVSVTRSSDLSDEKNNFGNFLKGNRPSHRTAKSPLVSDTKNTFDYNQLVLATPLPAQRKIAYEDTAFPSVETQFATPDVEMPDFVDVSIQKNDKGFQPSFPEMPSFATPDVEMPDFVDVSIQKNDKGFQPSFPEMPSSSFLSYDENIHEKSHQNWILPISSYKSQINYPVLTGDELTESAIQAHASLEAVDRAEERVTLTQIQVEPTPKLDMISGGPYQKEIHEKRQKEDVLLSVAHGKSEAAKQRFRMILRTWKRRASKKREIREQRQKLASIALNSLLLGPPVCQNEAQSRVGGKFNLDFVLEERNKRHWLSWSRLNVANTVASTLKKKNAKAKCLCWKLAVCIHKGDQEKRFYNLMRTWLLSKLIGRKGENDDELAAISSGLSIWKNVADGQGNLGPSICFSIVREILVEDCSRGASYDAMVGSSAAIYVVAESIPLEIQKVQIDMILTSIQSKSSIPLLIICSGSFGKYGHLVISRLGLQDVDKTKVSEISVISLDDEVPEEHLTGFFSDRNLQLGLKWLAEKTLPQPSLHLVKTRELVLHYLSPSIEALNDFGPSEVDPNRCVALFNKALDQSAKQIQDAAELNVNFWPCPEIDLLDVKIELPSTDWSATTKIKPILDAIKSCKLPYFSCDLSFLSHGSHLGKEISLHKAKLEECLVNYLTQSSKILSGDLAMKEARLMLQNGASLELHGLQYYLIPRWVNIFRRIYNWRLIKLKSRELASAYVLDMVASIKSEPLKPDLDSPLVPRSEACAVDGFPSKDSRQVLPVHYGLPLDEMVEVSCRFLAEEEDVPVRSLETRRDIVAPHHPSADIGVSEYEDLRFGRPSEAEDTIVSAPISQGTLTNPIAAAAVGFVKLKTLFGKCKIIQDRIDQKLSLYF